MEVRGPEEGNTETATQYTKLALGAHLSSHSFQIILNRQKVLVRFQQGTKAINGGLQRPRSLLRASKAC